MLERDRQGREISDVNVTREVKLGDLLGSLNEKTHPGSDRYGCEAIVWQDSLVDLTV